MTECLALLIATDRKSKPDVCLAGASFTSRGNPCCWVHLQADTKGPRAGKIDWFKRKAKR